MKNQSETKLEIMNAIKEIQTECETNKKTMKFPTHIAEYSGTTYLDIVICGFFSSIRFAENKKDRRKLRVDFVNYYPEKNVDENIEKEIEVPLLNKKEICHKIKNKIIENELKNIFRPGKDIVFIRLFEKCTEKYTKQINQEDFRNFLKIKFNVETNDQLELALNIGDNDSDDILSEFFKKIN